MNNAGMTPEEGRLTDRLAHGEAVPGGPGACARPGCAHALVWHSPTNRARPCERCDCPRYVEAPRQLTLANWTP